MYIYIILKICICICSYSLKVVLSIFDQKQSNPKKPPHTPGHISGTHRSCVLRNLGRWTPPFGTGPVPRCLVFLSAKLYPCCAMSKSTNDVEVGILDMILTLLIGTWFNKRGWNDYWWNRDCNDYWWFLWVHNGLLWLLNRYTALNIIIPIIRCIHHLFKHCINYITKAIVYALVLMGFNMFSS